MKKISILKIFSLLAIFFLSSVNIAAQCDYTDDFITLPPNSEPVFSGRAMQSSSSDNGWIINTCIRVDGGGGTGTTPGAYKPIPIGTVGVLLNGSLQYPGSLQSPVFPDGCNAISFKYAKNYSSTSYRKLKIEVIPVNGGATRTHIYEKEVPTRQFMYIDTIKGIDMRDACYITIANMCPAQNSAAVIYEELILWDVCVTSGSLLTIDGMNKEEGGFWDKVNITLRDRPGASVYYTTDGTEPTNAATPYSAPFELTQTTRLRAIWMIGASAEAILDTTISVTATNYRITAPEDALVFAGDKHVGVEVAGNYLKMHYIPFREKPPVYSATADGKTTYYYHLSGGHNYRVSRPGSLTHVGLFSPNGGSLEITEDQLTSRLPTDIDHDVNSLAGRNVADVWLNINPQGHLTLPMKADTFFQIVNCRNWQAINTDVDNYFIDPDFHYTVLDESGQTGSNVISISESGKITPLGIGTAIVLVTYDAMMAAHTNNVGGAPAFFSALWPENTGVFVVSVTDPDSPPPSITPNMFINEHWNSEGADKVGGIDLDAEHDVFYFKEADGGFDYTFSPEGAIAVSLAQPIMGDNSLSYSGFTPVLRNDDGSYTVRLLHGRNIVRLSGISGSVYQILTAKPVTWEISNLSRAGEPLRPGDEYQVLFKTLYHPSNKLSGIYNMSAGIQYTGFNTEFPLILGPGQYTFASRAQGYIQQIPADFNGDVVSLTNGVIKVRGYGSFYGEHRKITIQSGVAPNLNASVRTAYFGSLPDINIPLTAFPPTTPTNFIASPVTSESLFLQWTASTDNVGVAGYTIWMDGDSIASVAATTYIVENLTPGTTYDFKVAAYDAAGNRSATATATATTPTSSVPATGITLDRNTASLNVGATLQLLATVTPTNATNKVVKWESSDISVASVNSSGLITAVSAGSAEITAVTVSGNFTAKCVATVSGSGIAVTSVTLNRSTAELSVGESIQLLATVLPANAANKNLSWTSSNPYVAVVNANGLVTAVTAGGTAVIIATTADGGHIATCAIVTKAGGITVNPFELTQKSLFLYPGQTVALSLTAPQHFNVKWSSSNTSVATVSSFGIVTSIAAGTAQIIVEDVAQNRSDICYVTVAALPGTQTETIALNTSQLSLIQGETSTLRVTTSPGLSGKDVQWSSSNSAVANVTSAGTIVAIAPGTSIIKATIGSYSATCVVTVAAEVKEATIDNIGASEARLSFVKSAGATYYLVHMYKKQSSQLTPSFTLKVTPDGQAELRALAGNNLIVQLSALSPATTYIAEIEAVRETQGKSEVISSELLLFTTKNRTSAEQASKSTLKAWTQGSALHVSGLPAGEPWSLHSISGALIYKGIALSGEAQINLHVRGIYILSSGNNTIKIAH